ncbi:MAG: adenosylcobinamide-GDP ribazoletransferase [Acidobacteriaceae bacterium]
MSLRAPRFAIDIAVAFQFLTRLPLPPVTFAPDGLARSVKFFPMVGLVIGSGAALLEKVLAPHLGRPASAVVVLLYLVLITGCLHEDGLADVADSLGGRSPEQRLAILRDSRIGAYGAAALVFSLLSRAVLLAGLPLEHFTAYLISAHVLCRWSTLPLSYYLPPARESEGQGAGLGARIAKLTSASSLIFGSAFTIVTVVVALRKAAIAPLLSAIAIPLLSSFFYVRKFGGITGDCFGATNQLTEIAVYLCGVWTP